MSIDMLTKKQKELSDYIKRYIDKNGYSPTIEEMARHFKKAVGTIHEHLETLREKGVLEKLDNQPRAIQLLDTNNKEMIEIPLVGTIAAGQPIEAIEAGSETVAVLKDEIDDMSKYYALRVTGDSMINEGIFDGDIVLIRQQKTAENGQTVVAIIDDNEATLKKIYKEKTKFRLQPANQTLLPFFRKEVEIRGVVTKIIRNLDNKIEINNFNTLSEGNNTINELLIRNNLLTDQFFLWKFNSGKQNITSLNATNLTSLSNVFVYVATNYSTSGVYRTEASVNSSSYNDTEQEVAVI